MEATLVAKKTHKKNNSRIHWLKLFLCVQNISFNDFSIILNKANMIEYVGLIQNKNFYILSCHSNLDKTSERAWHRVRGKLDTISNTAIYLLKRAYEGAKVKRFYPVIMPVYKCF